MTDEQNKILDNLYQKRRENYYFNYAAAINEIINSNNIFIDEKFIEVLLYEALMGQLLICKNDFLVIREGYDSFFSKKSLNFIIQKIITSKFNILSKEINAQKLLSKYLDNKKILNYSIRINPSLSINYLDKIEDDMINNILYINPELVSYFDKYKNDSEKALICMINNPSVIAYFDDEVKKNVNVLKCALNNVFNNCRVGNLTDNEVFNSKNYIDSARLLLLNFNYDENKLTDEFIISLSIGMLVNYENEEVANETLALEKYFDEYINLYLGLNLSDYESKVQK